MPKLSEVEIQKRLIRLTNLERLHAQDEQTKAELRAENQQLKSDIVELKATFAAIVETQAARITELETMVFGRKPQGGHKASNKKRAKTNRSASSYRRPPPSDDEVTGKEHHAITNCRHCGGQLTDLQEHIRYLEDIVLAALTPDVNFKTVVRMAIERGWCSRCGKYSSARDLRGQEVSLGPQVRSLVCYLVTLRDHSYDQVVSILWDLYHFKITDGEITAILDSRRLQLLPEYENLKATIRAGPTHMDETSYPIQSERGAGYAHVMASAINEDAVFKLADSRGKGHSEDLIGDNYQNVGITDRYSAYKYLFLLHQICWAHLQRNARDLTHLQCLGQSKLKHVTKFYQALATIYAAIRAYQAEPFDAPTRQTQADALLEQTKQLCQPYRLDPKKLTDLKAGILEYQDCLFVCLIMDGIPADNNKAERALRKLVIKRKKSFGVKTPKGARTMEVLLSVAWSLYNRDRNNFFPTFHALGVTV